MGIFFGETVKPPLPPTIRVGRVVDWFVIRCQQGIGELCESNGLKQFDALRYIHELTACHQFAAKTCPILI